MCHFIFLCVVAPQISLCIGVVVVGVGEEGVGEVGSPKKDGSARRTFEG